VTEKAIWNYYRQAKKITRITMMGRGAQIIGAMLQCHLDFIQWCPVFVVPQHATGFLLLF